MYRGLFALVLVAAFTVQVKAEQPNIIYILLDDAGYGDLSCYGQKKFTTPNIDRLALEGMRFTDHYSGSTVCAPTRCSLMTGLHTGHCCVRGNREAKPEGQSPMPADIVNRPQEQAQYNASKAGVHHLTRSLAAEWAPRKVRVNAVAPTYIETELTRFVYDDPEMMKHWIGGTPMGRMGQPSEIAAVILFLASEASSLMTGSIVSADAGYTCW